jgi:hypothetical protein
MTRGRRVIFIIAIILAAIVFAGRVMRKDEGYLHAKHVSELQQLQPIGA